ncbi:hypothetical protein RMATCC62417_08270 [Rhizopus microsporus]|nr:hypothetical protein RMATCC62417_08270 [Rhizopus microsporus]
MLVNTQNVIHLQITNNTALRVIIYLPQDKIDWYNENNIHPQLLEALYPVIVESLIISQGKSANKRKKEEGMNRAVDLEGFRFLYRFVPLKVQNNMIISERDFIFQEDNNNDDKPVVKTNYKSMSVYPVQLLVSVDDALFINSTNTLDSYFTSLAGQ